MKHMRDFEAAHGYPEHSQEMKDLAKRAVRNRTRSPTPEQVMAAAHEVLNIQDACNHETERRAWDVNRAVSTTADVCTRCDAKLNQTFSSTMETR